MRLRLPKHLAVRFSPRPAPVETVEAREHEMRAQLVEATIRGYKRTLAMLEEEVQALRLADTHRGSS